MQKIKITGGIVLILFLLFWLYQHTESGTDKYSFPELSVRPTNNIGLDPGDTAPDLKFNSPDGNTVALSSLRGSIVLIDFWASWCGPCRIGNPHKVEAWKHFKNKKFINGNGFTFYSVSLDKSKEAWISGIENDRLEWTNHVSDLNGWNSVPAAIYKVKSIPASFLIDGDGVIIAKNLRGSLIAEVLNQYLKE